MQHLFVGFKHKVNNCSTKRMNRMKNSSDLERAPGARSISDEFSILFIRVVELHGCEVSSFSRSRCTFWEPESGEPRGGVWHVFSGAGIDVEHEKKVDLGVLRGADCHGLVAEAPFSMADGVYVKSTSSSR